MMSFILFSAMNNEQQIVNGKDYTDVVNNKVCKASMVNCTLINCQRQTQRRRWLNIKLIIV